MTYEVLLGALGSVQNGQKRLWFPGSSLAGEVGKPVGRLQVGILSSLATQRDFFYVISHSMEPLN